MHSSKLGNRPWSTYAQHLATFKLVTPPAITKANQTAAVAETIHTLEPLDNMRRPKEDECSVASTHLTSDHSMAVFENPATSALAPRTLTDGFTWISIYAGPTDGLALTRRRGLLAYRESRDIPTANHTNTRCSLAGVGLDIAPCFSRSDAAPVINDSRASPRVIFHRTFID